MTLGVPSGSGAFGATATGGGGIVTLGGGGVSAVFAATGGAGGVSAAGLADAVGAGSGGGATTIGGGGGTFTFGAGGSVGAGGGGIFTFGAGGSTAAVVLCRGTGTGAGAGGSVVFSSGGKLTCDRGAIGGGGAKRLGLPVAAPDASGTTRRDVAGASGRGLGAGPSLSNTDKSTETLSPAYPRYCPAAGDTAKVPMAINAANEMPEYLRT